MSEEAESGILIGELTHRLRLATMARHVGSLPQRLQDGLGELLLSFVSMNPVGVVYAHAYLKDQASTLPPLTSAELEPEPFFLFVWGSVSVRMLEHAMKTHGKSIGRDLRAGFDAFADRCCIMAHEPWKMFADDPDSLEVTLDQLAFAYVTGVSLAWAGLTKSAPADVQRLRAFVAKRPLADRQLFEERYARGRSTDQICRSRGLDVKAGPRLMAQALADAWGDHWLEEKNKPLQPS